MAQPELVTKTIVNGTGPNSQKLLEGVGMRVFVVDSHPVFREGLKSPLNSMFSQSEAVGIGATETDFATRLVSVTQFR
jgi:hypothetical protein